MGAEPKALKPKAPKPDSVDKLMGKLCDGLAVDHTGLFPGVYGVEAEATEHATLLSMLERVRELYTERYEVEIIWYGSSTEKAPRIGDPVTPTEPLHRHHLVVARRTPTKIAQVSRYAYISGINPVVATGAVGYAPEIGREHSGLHASIMVGAGSETETATSIRVWGDLRRVAMGKMGRMSGPVTTVESHSMEIELPAVSLRSIQSSIRIEYGKPTTLAVIDGFEDGECVVVAALVRRLSD